MNHTYTFDKYHNNFDIIRLLAALGVVISHSYDLLGQDMHEPLRRLTAGHYSLSYYGVRIFFIISGFLIFKSASNSNSTSGYFRKRSLRIFPALIVALLVCIFFFGPLTTQLSLHKYFSNSNTFTYFLNVLLYHSQQQLPGVYRVHNLYPVVNGSLWTLTYEFSFYILLYVAYTLKLLKTSVITILAFIALIITDVFIQDLSISTLYYPSINMSPGAFIDFSIFFLSGVIFAQLSDHIKITFISGTLAFFLFLSLTLYSNSFFNKIANYLILPYILFFISFIKGRLNHAGKHGDFSYGIYIYSYPIQQTLIHFFPKISPFFLIIVSLFALIPFAYFSWFKIEKPMLLLKFRKPVAADIITSLPV